ncbi:hypothetical protein G5B46_05675 [Caulobacter sp. 602-2]|uniref:SbsA Ig-like domain-containing protein n=2 Tax=Caulobacter sp. 602-2 TaxID=2710887 RepID=A0A6G4QU73_9CAUL|nr:hypothetical protein [Caulobacter sp. 602-2]NGM49091.1 hypothetical protein [Caulobacter sp. 602-2]
MRIAVTALPVLAVLAVAGGAFAQVTRPEPTPVSPVTVMPPTQPPKVTATWPAAGETVAPGILVLKVSFDQKMLPGGWNYAAAAGGEKPECVRAPRLLNDRKTFVLLCSTKPGKGYAVAFNAVREGGFANEAENPALTAELAFTTSKDPSVYTLKSAMKAAGLKDDEAPIQEAPKLVATTP